MQNVLSVISMLHFAEVPVPCFTQIWFSRCWYGVWKRMMRRVVGKIMPSKKRRLTWIKYIDDADHFAENFDGLVCTHYSCSSCENWYWKFLIHSCPYHLLYIKILKFSYSFIIYKSKWKNLAQMFSQEWPEGISLTIRRR